ncbi:glycoside hydrolase family 2 TIM barrel-domain containing protein [Enterocloster lavalensis]|uniref:glycoside hydrolase family 2 TIM barrel-domain containing protein n=1 Tax=Enterocloster lavalensis TaxID=460384 RepID=UPI0023F2CD1F|nr:glycoside hydrolase family 2 TIM barrel-domain containing protein [Enterocloster lavalensis]
MLYPRENRARAVMNLDGEWSFCLDDGTGLTRHWEREPLKNAERIAVPASYNDQKDKREYRNHCGWVFYQRQVTVPAFYRGQRLFLRMDAVTNNALVWLDGSLICEHRGGFLPFEVEITDRVLPGEAALLTIAADNRISHSTLPVGNEGTTAFFGSDNPGVPSVEAAKKWRGQQNAPNFDFFNYAGINRPVRIYTTPQRYIRDLELVPGVDGGDGLVRYRVETGGDMEESGGCSRQPGNAECGEQDGNCKTASGAGRTVDQAGSVQIEILDAQGSIVARAVGPSGEIRIPRARRWQPRPGIPYLYTARVIYGEDVYEQTFGIRTVEVRGTRFLINGEPFYFKGFGKHEDSAFHGRGLDFCLNIRDLSLLDWIHANSFRTSHYPYAEEMYELCDKEGIVIIDETPAVGIGAGESVNPYETFPLKEYHEQVLEELIHRDKNHPCVVMWSLGNEPDTEHFPQSAYDYWRALYDLAHDLDPQNRPVTFVCCQNDYTRDIMTRTMDVVCLNRYYGWYNLSGDLDAACYGLNLELDFWELQGKPVMFTEYGADAMPGVHMTVPEMFSEEYQAEYLDRIDRELDKRSFFIGEQVWNFADYATIQGCMRVDGNRKGVFTRDRRPKLAAHFLRKRWADIPNFGYKNPAAAAD